MPIARLWSYTILISMPCPRYGLTRRCCHNPDMVLHVDS
ncbi:Ribosomal N-lysine methyltransferase 1 [Gossypium arboreum]|uniref:Ribosomal N-lysine methyltransferase 1 n=1 Tax=Gossypium arboreum TaxID=29729 RepID=A0A0B0N3W5_GOSAR|nr:Ribosomal N-lysine methyltransferase 1 [Gossypium arboreum]